MRVYDLIIIGAGPAGLTAALYAGRFRLNVLVLEKISPGGQITLSVLIENFPGFPGGIATQELIERLQKQTEEVGVKIKIEEVLEILPQDTLYSIKTSETTYQAKTVIIASGAQAKRLGIEGEEKFIGRGVSYCGTCDGPFFKEKEIVLMGGGDRAIEEALYLASYAKKVTVIHRRQELRASGILEEKARANPKINFILDTVLEKIQGSQKVEAVGLKNVKTGTTGSLPCQGVFIFVGINPNTQFLKNLLQVDEAGFIITQLDASTSRQGVFACGDCCKKYLYQVVNACGEGAVACDSAHKYLIRRR